MDEIPRVLWMVLYWQSSDEVPQVLSAHFSEAKAREAAADEIMGLEAGR